MRLTKKVREQLMEQNEGFKASTHYSGKNFNESRDYEISGGRVHIRATGKTSWADSRYSKNWVADDEETRRFLYEHKGQLNTDGLDN